MPANWPCPDSDSTAQKIRRADFVLFVSVLFCLLVMLALFLEDFKIFAVGILLSMLPWAVRFTSRNTMWLLMPLILIEAITGSKFLSEDLTPLVRYSLVPLFCIPILPALWRSGLLKKGGFLCYTIYFLWALVSCSYSLIPYMSLGRTISSLLPFCAISAIASASKDGNDARRAMGVVSLACGLIVVANYIMLTVLPGEAFSADRETGIQRFTGTFTEPNQIGALMLTTIGAVFCYWRLATGRVKVLCAAAILGAALLGVMADSRSPFVGLAIGGAAFLLWKYRTKGAMAITLFGVSLFFAVQVLPNGTAYFTRGEVTTATGRDVVWSFAIRSIAERPILGYGYEVEGEIFQSRHFTEWDEIWEAGPRSSIHDGFLSRAVSLGVPALAFWLFFIIRPVVSCFRPQRDSWSLKSFALLALTPGIILNITESVADCRSLDGILLALSWAMLERQRMLLTVHPADSALLQSTQQWRRGPLGNFGAH